ncbi:MAG: zinc ABC transporter solute-binding protein [Gammaproteobacteria bacterium]|nr:zinc ABC transporter solute-binding protein [Gammaproteobacteria bacterium]
MRLLIVFVLLLAPASSFAKLQIFACEPEWAALSAALAGEQADTFTATTALQDPHHIEARPSLIARMRNADLVVCSGAELETGWLPLLLRTSANPKVQLNQPGYFEAAMQVERLDIPAQLDRSAGDVHSQGNPHVHLDPHRLLKIGAALSARLQAIDADNADKYRQRLQQWNADFSRAIAQWEQQAAGLRGKKVVVYHDNWKYLVEWLQLKQIATIEPRPGIPPSGADQKRLLEKLAADKPAAILVAAFENAKAAHWLGEKMQVPVIVLPFTAGGDEQSADLPALFTRTLQLLNGSAP